MIKRPLSLGAILIAVATLYGESSRAACTLPGPPYSALLVAQAQKTPQSLLEMFPRGGRQMQGMVSELLAMDVANTPKMTYLALLANAPQRMAIAKGLRWAADICGAHDAELGHRILREVLRSGSPDLAAQYNESDNLGEDPALTVTHPVLLPPTAPNPTQLAPALGDPSAPMEFHAAIVVDPFKPMDPLN